MIRKYLNTGGGEEHFRWRGGDVSRLEGLTDGVFALALTLLVISLEVPASWEEMKEAFYQIPVFLVCFALLYYIWYSHYLFHRRYGLEDRVTIWLNSALLFLVMFSVYPLKFLAQMLFTAMRSDTGGQPFQLDAVGNPIPDPDAPGEFLLMIEQADIPELMVAYSAGYLGIFLVLASGTWRAWRFRDLLALTPIECELTLGVIREQVIMVVFALVSLAIVLTNGDWAPLSGMIYMLTGPVLGWNGWLISKRVEALLKKEATTHNP